VHEWIDLDLLSYMAKRHPEWSIVLVGRVASIWRPGKLPNVHWLSGRPYASLPGYAKGFSAAILPFKINRLTESVNPIKLREYLAAGLPVVSTPLPEVKAYNGLVRIGATADEFVNQVELAVQDTGEWPPGAGSKRSAGHVAFTRRYMSTLVEASSGRETLLICHEGAVLDREGLARWLASFSTLAV